MSGKLISRRDFLRAAVTSAAAAAMAACAPATPAAAPTSAPAAATTAPTKAPAVKTPVKLRWWGGVPEANGPKQSVEAFNKIDPNIQVEYIQYPNNDEGNVKMDTALQADGEVDVVVSYGLARLKQRADAGALEPLDAYLNGFDPLKEYGKLDNQWDGKYWALILAMQPRFVFMNKAALDEVGLKVPTDWTWDEYADYAQKLVKGSGATKRYGAFNATGDGAVFEPVYLLKGGDYLYKDACTTNFDDPSYLQAFNLRMRLQNTDKSIAPLGDVTAGKLQPYSEFTGGKSAMLIEGSWILRYIKDVANNPRSFMTTFAPMPHWKDTPNAYRPGNADDRCSIAKKSKNKDAAWTFMKWWGTEGYINMTPFGRMSMWKSRKIEDTANAYLSDFADSAKYLDVEAYKRVVFAMADKNFPIQFNATAASELNQIQKEEIEKVLLGDAKPEDAVKNIKKRGDDALGKVCKK
jgi:multiple sugar transport system substrate-binding protein